MALRKPEFKLQTRIAAPVSAFIIIFVLGGALVLAMLDGKRVADGVEQEAAQQRAAAHSVLEMIDTLVTSQARGAMGVLQQRGAAAGSPSLDGRTEVGERSAPGLYFGEQLQNNRFELVDGVADTLGGSATLFVRDGQDFVRVSTNVISGGKRAIGTVLSPTGRAMAAIRQGKSYFGLVDILGEPYIAGYSPMLSAAGDTVGIWYVGFKLDMAVLEAFVADASLLQSGFLALLDQGGKIRFLSSHVAPEAADAALAAGQEGGWIVRRDTFAPWGFELANAYRADEVSAASSGRALAIVGAGIGACALMILLLVWLVRRLVIRPLGGEPAYAVAVAERIAEGRLDEKVELRPGDQQSVMAGMARGQASISKLVARMRHMSAEHDKGDIDVVIPVDEFRGDYAAVASGVNEMVDGHIAVKKKAMGCVAEFGRGNFEAELEQFPGKKAFINETVEKVRENLKALIADANMLSDAALAGKLDTRADVSRHEGDFRKIVGGVNDTLDAVVGPINEVKRVMLGLAEGDLRQKIDGTYHGEFKVLQEAVNDSMDKLKELISGIKGAADTINTGAKEIAAGNTNLSQRTEEQASSLEETASSMEELTSTVKQNADNARQANQLAHGASDVATKGGDKVREVVVTMGAITESSRKISDIIQVIDGIAFQTNILALNAAVEAARAGEQGRGFAVVAGEVRNLAQRSAGAAKEIKTLIGDSVETVEGGSKLVEEAGATMEEIVTAVKRVTDIMAEISAASDEQSQGIEQVSTAVAQMDEVTQQNAALVEESAAAAGSMEDQAHNLAEAVAIFRIDDGKSTHIANPQKTAKPVAKPLAKPAAAKPRAPAKPPRPATADAGEEWAEF